MVVSSDWTSGFGVPGFSAVRSTGTHLIGSLAWDGCSLCSPHDEFYEVDLMSHRSECFLWSSSELSVLLPSAGSPLPQALYWLAPSVVGRLGQFLSCWDPRPYCRGGWCTVFAGSIGGNTSRAIQEARQPNWWPHRWWAWCPNCWYQRPGWRSWV